MKQLFFNVTSTIKCKGTTLASFLRAAPERLTRLSPEQRAWALRCGHHSLLPR